VSRLNRELSHWARTARKSANALFSRSGFRIVRSSSTLIDLTEVTTDPIEGRYRAGLRPFLMRFSLADCRILPGSGFACSVGVGNPFVDALTVGAGTADAESELGAFYRRWRPKSAGEVLGLPDNAILSKCPPLAFVMPWQDRTPEQSLRRWQDLVDKDNREHGSGDAHGQGWKGWGPVSDTIAAQETTRLRAVYQSIKTAGYRRDDTDDGDVKGTVIWSGEARVIISAGHHRAAAMAALGASILPVRIDNPIVRRDEVGFWPNVRSGLFGESEALALFDRLFEGRQPAGYWSGEAG
jgi:hypothetical protein